LELQSSCGITANEGLKYRRGLEIYYLNVFGAIRFSRLGVKMTDVGLALSRRWRSWLSSASREDVVPVHRWFWRQTNRRTNVHCHRL